MIISRSSNSFLISTAAHIAFLFFVANFTSKVAPQIGIQPFKPSEVSALDDAEKKRVRDWLEKQRKERDIQPDQAPKDVSADITRKLFFKFSD
jgi:hypothetical protein